jgi:2-dehydro-3-deoxygluconokinase
MILFEGVLVPTYVLSLGYGNSMKKMADRVQEHGTSLCVFGEVMLELSSSGSDLCPQQAINLSGNFAGDTFNTSVLLARSGCSVEYVTALGDDAFSFEILAMMRSEGVGAKGIQCLDGRQPGLYLIENDIHGERQFRYWRQEAPVRELFCNTNHVLEFEALASSSTAVYVSGISLAILKPEARQALLLTLEALHQAGGIVVFDSNYRASLWNSAREAERAFDAILAFTDICLLTFDDEYEVRGLDSVEALFSHYQDRFSISEIIIKQGARETHAACGEETFSVPVKPVGEVVDTTGAGDAFNAGYLSARLKGERVIQAIHSGHSYASIVIQQQGAIPEKEAFRDQIAVARRA